MTLLPSEARESARFVAMVDLPSLGIVLVMSSTCCCRSSIYLMSFTRRLRMDSVKAAEMFGFVIVRCRRSLLECFFSLMEGI